MQPIAVLSIAGSDSGGGAGIQADIRTLSAFGVHATTAITAVTAQNTVGVSAIAVIAPDVVAEQVRAVDDDFTLRAVKTGMLAQASTVEVVAELAREGRLPHLVVDPVLVSSTGHVLMADGGVDAYRDALIPLAQVATPNLREACLLADVDIHDITDVAAMTELARAVLERGSTWVLVKGGHLDALREQGVGAPDVLVSSDEVIVFNAPRVTTINDHGTGCSLSAAIAAGLGLGRSVPDAVRDAKSFVLAGLEGAQSWQLGHGHGPIDHFGWSS